MGHPEVIFAVIVTLSALVVVRVVRSKHTLILARSGGRTSRGLAALAQATLIVYYLCVLRIALLPFPWGWTAVPWALLVIALLCIWFGLEVLLRVVARQGDGVIKSDVRDLPS